MTEVRLYRDPDWLHQKYVKERWSTYDIAGECGVTSSTVRKWMDRFGIDRRSKGGIMKLHCRCETMKTGYEEIIGYSPDTGNKERVLLHRLLAVAKYGVEAVKDMDVHHKNGIRWDNRPNNIELIPHDEHPKLHSRERSENGQFK